MNEEEKEAIQMLDKFITEHKFYNIKHSDNLEDNIEIVLNLIEKLQKENEELKGTLRDTQNSWFEDTKKMEKLKKDFNEANNIAIKNMTEYVSKAEIKDKIEDLKMSGGSDGKDNTENTARELAIEALQDILEESEDSKDGEG